MTQIAIITICCQLLHSMEVKVFFNPVGNRRWTDLTEEPVISDLGTLTAGIDKTVTCAPPGNCPVTSLVIQWKKSDVSGIWKNSSTITFTPSPDDHRKNITCEVTNSRGRTTQRTIVLDVCSPASITITWEIIGKKKNKLDSFKVTEGSSVTLRCSVQSNLTRNVTWTDGKDNVLQRGTEKDLELRLENMTMNHTGTYTCSALTECLRNSANVNITVQYPPRNMEITIHSSKGGEHIASPRVDINQNETLTLVCSAEGNPPVTVVWIRGEVEVDTSIMSNNGLSAVINVTSSMADVYQCLAWNSIGLRERRVQVGTKDHPPRNMKITINSSKGKERPVSSQVDIDEMEILTLVCSAEGNPPVTVVWMRGEDDANTYNISNNGLSAVINVTSSEADVYQCLAWNGLGLREQRIQVGTKQGPVAEQKSSATISYRDIAIAFVCGVVFTALIILLYKCILRKVFDKKMIYVNEKGLSDSADPPTDVVYMNFDKAEQHAEDGTDNNIQEDSRGFTLDQDDLHYSTVAFTEKLSKIPSSQPETEYAEIKRK